jgi:integrase
MAKIKIVTHKGVDKYCTVGRYNEVTSRKLFTVGNELAYEQACYWLYKFEVDAFENKLLSELDRRKSFTIEKMLQFHIGWKVDEVERNRGTFSSIKTIISEAKAVPEEIKEKSMWEMTTKQLDSYKNQRFYLWLRAATKQHKKIIGIEPDLLPKPDSAKKTKSKSRARYASDAEIKTLYSSCVDDRERMYVYLFAYLGLRLGEAIAVKKENVRDGYLSIVNHVTRDKIIEGTKGKNCRDIPTHTSFEDLVGRIDGDYLLSKKLSNKGGMSNTALYKEISKPLAKRSGFYYPPSFLRKYYGSKSLRTGVSLFEVCQRMGHSDVSITAKYYLYCDNDESGVISPI